MTENLILRAREVAAGDWKIANSLTVGRGRIEANFRRAALTDLALLDTAIDIKRTSTPGAKHYA